jgi:hypothetical protein
MCRRRTASKAVSVARYASEAIVRQDSAQLRYCSAQAFMCESWPIRAQSSAQRWQTTAQIGPNRKVALSIVSNGLARVNGEYPALGSGGLSQSQRTTIIAKTGWRSQQRMRRYPAHQRPYESVSPVRYFRIPPKLLACPQSAALHVPEYKCGT